MLSTVTAQRPGNGILKRITLVGKIIHHRRIPLETGKNSPSQLKEDMMRTLDDFQNLDANSFVTFQAPTFLASPVPRPKTEKQMLRERIEALECAQAKAVAINHIPTEIDWTQQQKDYLMSRLNEVEYSHKKALKTKFRMDKAECPKTFKDAIAALKAGHFTFTWDDNTILNGGVDPMCYFSWHTKPQDAEGYEAAKEELKKARTLVLDEIMTLDYDTGLKAVQEFKDWKLN